MSTLKVTTLSNLAGSASVPMDTVISGSAKAWVNLNGTGTVAIREGFNVSSIFDNGVGNYTLNFTNLLVDASYASLAACSAYSGDRVATVDLVTISAASAQIKTGVSGGSSQTGIFFDPLIVNFAVFR